jgi:5-methylcytosine-specific restriction endonuclease McrA
VPHLPAALRRLVIERAGNRCEYCLLSQIGQEATFHVDHVVPVAVGGPTEADNLALACVSCSLRKAARETAADPATGEDAPIFNPRRQCWDESFRWDGTRLVGATATGRATVAALALNRPLILAIRAEAAAVGGHPPP